MTAGRRTRILLIALLAVIAFDLTRPPSSQFSARAAVLAIRAYQHTLSPLLGQMGVRCRFKPTCSHYGEIVIARDGVVRGAWKIAGRIVRCGPWTPMGTVDEP